MILALLIGLANLTKTSEYLECHHRPFPSD